MPEHKKSGHAKRSTTRKKSVNTATAKGRRLTSSARKPRKKT